MAVLAKKNLGGGLERQVNIVSSAAISNRWKNWGGGAEQKVGAPDPGLEPPLETDDTREKILKRRMKCLMHGRDGL